MNNILLNNRVACNKGKLLSTIFNTLGGIVLLSCISSANAVQPLSVNGNQILAGGKPASFAGNSLFWSNNGWGGEKFYNAGTVAWLKRDWQSTLVRAAMGVDEAGGYLQDPVGNKNKVKAVVNAAIANDMYVIIDWHSHYAERYRDQSIGFFQEMARTYGGSNNVIYEIYNEPLNTTSWSGTVKPYAQAVVNAIRAIDPDNLIIVGTPTWSQDVDIASRDKVAGRNIAYTLHFYAGTHGQYLRDKAQTALNNGAALFVTEWGSVNADGNGGVNNSETYAWVAFMKDRNISNANWALNDKAEGASALRPGASGNGGWTSNQLTASGALSKSIILGWPRNDDNNNGLNVTIQAENFAVVGGVETQGTSDAGGGLNVGWIDSGDWMSYTNSPVTIPSTGSYTIEYRVASLNGGGGLKFEEAGGSPVYGTIGIPRTGGWQNWVTISHRVNLSAGTHKFGINATSGGWNINWFRITKN